MRRDFATFATFEIAVKRGEKLPQPNQKWFGVSPMTGICYRMRITRIIGLRWLPGGDIAVEVRGTRHALAEDEEEGVRP